MVRFICMNYSGVSMIHSTTFYSCGQEYELKLQRITEYTQGESSIIFPNNFIFSRCDCWEVVFDLAVNIASRNLFATPASGLVNAVSVMRIVERLILAHYGEYHAGMYVFLADNHRLAAIYQKLACRRLGRGFTLEVGLDPDRRGYVLRTPRCY